MSRVRSKEDKWLPPRVYKGRTRYYFKTLENKTVMLCPLTASKEELYEAHLAALKRAPLSVGDLAKEYFASREFLRRRVSTQDSYWEYWKMLEKVWAKLDARKVMQIHVRKYMDKRGEKSEVSANREFSVLRNIFSYGFERSKIKANPCDGVKQFPEKAREKYIEDSEYYPFLEKSKKIIQAIMEISYCCAARGQDVRTLTMPQLTDAGIFIRQGKTGKKQIKKWTPRLKDAVDLAKSLRSAILEDVGVISPYLIVTQGGTPYTASGLKTLWAKNKLEIKRKYGIAIDWTFHDIKAKAISDYDGDKQQFSGHKTASQVGVYDRKPALSPTLETEFRPLSIPQPIPQD